MLFQVTHDGHWPSDIVSLAAADADGHLPPSMINARLTCPGRGEADDPQTSDYIYINWKSLLSTNNIPGDFPLIYDRHSSNHHGWGINVMRVDGTCFWDFRGRWLKAFAKTNSNANLSFDE